MQPALQRDFRRPGGRSRRGLSLLELMLVLALLVVIAALAAPALERPLEAHKLRKAAELVQAQWDRARIRAMQTGQIMVFQYQPTTGRFRVQPWYSDDFSLEANAAAGSAPSSAADPLSVTDELPEGVEFLTSMTLSESRSLAVEEELSRTSGAASLENSWSAPILFYADGTASTAEVMLVNQHGAYVTLRLRGLTGVARVGDVFSTGTGEAPE